MSEEYDLIVIGAGPGGYVAAIRGAQLGLKVACVESRKTLGGTCLNVGCIPSKALLVSSEKYSEAIHKLLPHGVNVGSVGLDLGVMMSRKERVVGENASGIEHLFRKNGVAWIKGRARLDANGGVFVSGSLGEAFYKAKNIIIATGSESAELQGVVMDGKRVVTSTEALSLAAVPQSMIVIGAGAIGLELGSVWSRLGASVTVIEYCERVLPTMDREVSAAMRKMLEGQGIGFRLGRKVLSAASEGDKAVVAIEAAAGGDAEKLSADVVLVAVGRRACTDGLGLDAAGVRVDSRGRIEVDEQFRTGVSGIYAVGDVIAGAMLAHKAEEEGMACAEIVAGRSGHVDYDSIPSVVYTNPEAASVGKTEDELTAAGVVYRVGRFPFSANGRARAMGETEGFVKVLADAKTDRLLGAHIVGADAGTLIAELALALAFGASSEDVARTCHAHPSLNEAVKEASMSACDVCIHM